MKFGSGLKKVKKKDPIKMAILRTPPPLVGAIYVYGRIKSGKTVSILSLAGLYHDNPSRRCKIFDLWGGDRNEHLYWTLPSNKENYWNYISKVLRLTDKGPRQYKVNLWYPLIASKLPKKLPFLPDYVQSKLFTIPLRDLTVDDFALVVGQVTDSSVGHWKEVIYNSKKKTTASEMIGKYKKSVPKTNTLYNAVLKPLTRELLFQDDNCIYNLDTRTMSKELDDQETISVICLDFVDKEYKLLVIGYIIRKMCEELDRKRRNVIGVMREASEFFRVNDQSVVPDRYKVLKSYLANWIKMGRRGFHLLLDTQSPNETKGMVDGQQDLTLLGRLPAETDRRIATEQLAKDGLVTKSQVRLLATNEPGQFLFCPSGRHASFNYVMMPKCRFWEESNGNFYKNVWANEVGRWVGYKEEIDMLRIKYKENEEQFKEENKKKSKKKPPKTESNNKVEEVQVANILPEKPKEEYDSWI